ncbi:hypothetical protein FJZ41_03285, partial [Candidatus Shapirobacteria bacterium]|nr:hypothetical protein [Candidatus Shapirobacteria bacterium]
MENFGLLSAKIVGTPTEKSGSWVHTFSPSDEEKRTQRGQLLAVIGLNNFRGEQELAAVGKEIVSRLQEEYYGQLADDAFTQLKNTVEKVAQEAKSGTEFELNLGTVVVVGNRLYGVMSQGAQLLILRQEQMLPLFTGEETGSGYLQNQDVFLLGTEEFFRLVKAEMIQAALKASHPQEAVEILAPAIHGQPDGSSAAIVFRVFSQEKDLQKAAIPPEPAVSEKKTFKLGFNLKEKLFGLVAFMDDRLKKRLVYLQKNKEKSSRSPKTLMSVAVILLVILGVSVFFGMRQRKNLGLSTQAVSLLEQAQAKKEEGESLLGLNPAKSQQLLLEAQGLVLEIEKLGGQSEEFLQFKQDLEILLATAIKEFQVEGEVFFDLELIKSGAQGQDLLLVKDQIIIFDKEGQAVYSLGVQDKKSTILFGHEDLKEGSFLAEARDKFYVFTSQGILEGGKLPTMKIEADEEWGQIKGLKGFTGSLYLLDGQGEIWKYPPIEGGFGNKQAWLKNKADFSQAVSWAIDGSIWVLNQNGTV